MAEDLNQDSVNDNQNFEIDIEQLYDDFITSIDTIRSKVPGISKEELTLSTVNSAASDVKISDDYQESRCHAFYRLIGFPVAASATQFYSPGFNKEINEDESKLEEQIKKAAEFLKNEPLIALMDKREIDCLRTYNDFFELQDINASVLALSSSNTKNLREFKSSLEKSTENPFEVLKQSHNVVFKSSDEKSLLQYVNLNNISALGLPPTRSHIIKPFLVDPRIDFIILPAENRIAAPFLPNKTSTKLYDNIYVQRPYIESVCRIRFDEGSKKSEQSADEKKLINNILTSKTFKNSDILRAVAAKDPAKIYEASQLIKFLNIFRSMCKKLNIALKKISEVENKYRWTPIPNKKGPEFGSSTQDIVINNDSALNHGEEVDIVDKELQSSIDKILSKQLEKDTIDLGNFALSKIQVSPDGENARSYGNINDDDINKLKEKRERVCSQANDALRTIEIIMGEFSGLGFCDIIAIYSALWLVDKKYVAGMMDDDAQKRMLNIPKFVSADIAPSVEISLNEFGKKVKEMYEIMQLIYKNEIENNINSGES